MAGDNRRSFAAKFAWVLSLGLVIFVCLLPSVALSDDVPTGGDGSGDSSVGKIALGGGDTSSGSDTALPDLFTGAMSYRIPIEVPPGRNSMEPDLALTYSSRNGNGWVGLGWELEVGAIERSTRYGVDYTKDNYVLRRAGSLSELVYDTNSGTYRSKIESEFIQITKQSDGSFIAVDKKGIKFYFGATPDSVLVGSPGTFRWSLSSIEDTFGNVITFSYSTYYEVNANGTSTNTAQIYLSSIDYNGNRIRFYTEPRNDAPEMYTANFLIKTTRRLKTIDILRVNESRVRTYKLSYMTSPATGNSVLATVQQFGKDTNVDTAGTITNEAAATKLPAQNFGINNQTNSFSEQQWTSSGHNWGAGSYTWAGDFNGDGRMDIATAVGGTTIYVKISKADQNGNDSFEEQVWTTNAPHWGDPIYTWIGDFNGDGRTDIATAVDGKIFVKVSKVDQNGNDSFEEQVWATNAPNWSDSIYTWVGDFNGDGRMDIATAVAGNIYVKVSKVDQNGNDTFEEQLWATNAPHWGSAAYIWVGDFNGDGRMDIATAVDGKIYVKVSKVDQNGNDTFEEQVWATNAPNWGGIGWARVGDFNGDGKMDIATMTGGTTIWVKLSTGTSFIEQNWTPNPAPNWGDYSHTWVADFNGDGKADIATASGGTIWVKRSTGSTFIEEVWTTTAPAWGDVGYTYVGDFNGDGKPDIATAISGNIWVKQVSDFAVDKIMKIDNGYGDSTEIDYTPSTHFHNANLPFSLPVVSKMRHTLDNGPPLDIASIDYEGGYYYIPERDFRGFNHVTVTGSAGPSGEQKITETWFHQGNDVDIDVNNPNKRTGYMKGKPYRVRVRNAANPSRTFTETETVYAANKPGDVFYFNPPQGVHTYICDGTAVGKCRDTAYARHLRTDYFYDYLAPTEYGNLSYEYHYGDADDSTQNDKFTIYRTYSPNTTSNIVGLPTSETVYQGLGTTTPVAITNYFYDGVQNCDSASTNQSPDKGKLTRIVRWLHYGDNQGNVQNTTTEERMAYDPYGNLFCRRDANGNTTTTGYDPSSTFPISVASPPTPNNPAGLTTTTSYYGVNGVVADKGLYGQVKSVTDANSSTIITEYDPLGRKSKELRPDSTWTGWAYNNFGTVGSQHVRMSDSNGLWKESYFDGLGRTYREKSQAPESKIVAIDTVYDATSAVYKSSLPYFYELETPRYIVTDHDAVGRVTRTGQESPAEYIRSLACYNNDVTVKIDPNNHRRREVRDANGRLVKVQEYTGTSDTCSTEEGTPYATTTYTYDVLGNLLFVTDAKRNQTEMRYDTLGRKRYMSDPDMRVWTYDYDPNGNLTTQTDAKQQIITFHYDALNRLASKYHGSTLVLTNYYDEATSSNSKGRLSRMTDLPGRTVYNYDLMGRITSSTKTIDGTPYTLGFGYPNGRLESITYPDSETVTYSYDAGTLQGVTGYVSYMNFDALGRPWNAVYGMGGASSLFTYDPDTKRLATLQVFSPDPTQGLKHDRRLIDNSYGYDNKGNIKSITDHLDRPLPTNISSETYTPARAHAVGSTGSGRIFQYDENGNMCNDNGTTCSGKFIYNYDNMPTAIDNVGFAYDGSGTRVKKTSPGFSTHYIDKLYECTNGTCTKYIFAGTRRIAVKSGTVVLYYHPDHQGSTAMVTDANGRAQENIAYYPFGGTRSDDGGIINIEHKYTGQELDSEIGLYNYNARIYDPDLGRFLTPDTVVPNPADPQSLNRYAYARNNPVLYNDPTGHWFGLDDLVATVVGAIVGGISAAIQGGDIWQGMGIGAAAGWVGYNTFGAAAGEISHWGLAGGVGPPTQGMIAAGQMGGSIVGGAAGGATAGGMSAGINGGNVGDGMLLGAGYGAATGAIVGGLTTAASYMRSEMVEQSQIDPRNASGKSVGFNGDNFKLAGGRWTEGVAPENQSVSPLGGQQGGKGSFFGIGYTPGSIFDRVAEAYAGPHDYLNNWYWYNSNGNAIQYTGFAKFFGESLNFTNVFVATPFVAASVTPQYAIPPAMYDYGRRRWP